MTDSLPIQQQCGIIAIIGAPNVGKSTLVNALVGSKVTIVSPKVQTTRTLIRGIYIEDSAQVVLVDTPGIFQKPKRSLEQAIVRAAHASFQDADLYALVVNVKKGICDDTAHVIEALKQQKRKAHLVLNKIDTIPKDALLPLAKELFDHGCFDEVFMISALKGDGVSDLRTAFAKASPPGPWLYDPEDMTDAPIRFLASEVTREKCFLLLQQEIPYMLAVETEHWKQVEDGKVEIYQVIYVAKESHKRIALGKNGQTLKSIGMASRKELESMIDQKVYLKLFIKVREGWIDRPDDFIHQH